MGELINPYIAGAPVTEARMFFGREDVFQWIENSIAGQYADHILVIHGQRRVGKTSVLKQLGNRLPKRFIPVFFDLQGRTHTTLDRFLWWLAREIVRVLKQERGMEVPLPEKDAFAADIEYFEHRFLPDLKPALGHDTLLLTFDEFDNLEESEVKEELARPLTDYLRRLMGNGGLNFIFSIGSSGRKLENMQAAYTEFFKTALYKKISFLNEDQTRNLITRPIENIIEYDKRAVTRIYQLAGGHPYFTQLTCHELFAKCQQSEERIIKAADVEAILDDVVERGTVNLKFVWDEASDIEKWSLSALAQLDKSDYRVVADYLRKNRVRFSDTDLTSGLLHLREKDILTAENRFVIHLLKLWLRKNRPIEQVREELTEVNPIASRYIEIGLEFKDSHLYEKAIESFQEALAVAKDNVQAQVNIGLVYMDMKAYDKAVIEFEKTLTMDDEDVSARSGLCDAHLSLGDSAMSKGRIKDAVISYQRVLAINTEHTEARGRMAEIARQRAEKALTDGKDEEALSAFTEALKHTPEDPALIARVDQVRAEKKAKVFAALVARSEKEMGTKNWEGAIKALEEALPLAPGDASIHKRINEIKAVQEKARLDGLLAKADTAAKIGRWDEAISALTVFLSAKPDEAVETKLREVRANQREAKLIELKAQARGLTRAERFDGALSAWEAYLALDPADRETVQVEIGQVKSAQALARSYADAEKAFAKRHYDQAVNLLKGIVNQDENYRDASYLLSQAIELRRTARKWWQSKWLRGVVVGSMALVVGWFAFRPGSLLMAIMQSAPTEAAITTSVPTTSNVVNTTTTATAIPPTATAPLPYRWARLNSGQFLPRMNVTGIVVDPADSGVIYVSTETSGVYKSIDGGISWQPSHAGLEQSSIGRLLIDPQNTNILYGISEVGIYKTTDGGRNWNLLYPMKYFTSLIMDPFNHEHLYFVDGDFYHETQYMYQSTDSGVTWSKLQTPNCPSSFARLTLHPEISNTLFLTFTSYFEINECNQGLYVSEDGGQTWNFTPANIERIDQLRILKIQTKPSEVIYGSIQIIGQSFALYKSLDRGKSWSLMLDNRCFAMDNDPADPKRLFCGSFGQLLVTEDDGNKWTSVLDTNGWLTAIAFSSDSIFVGEMLGRGLYKSNDGGKTWEEQNSGMGGIYFNLHVNQTQNTNWYIEEETGVHRSSDFGKTWNLVDEQGQLLALGSDGNTLYRLGEEGVLLSKDAGNTWTSLRVPPVDYMAGIATLSQQPSTVLVLYKNGYHFSTDSGETWDTTSENAWEQMSFDDTTTPILYSDTTRQQLYAIGIDANTESLHSEDGGKNWEVCAPIDTIFPFSPSNLSFDPTDKRRLIVATKKGVFISTDSCRSWQAINNGLSSLYVNSVAIDPNNPDTLFAGTDGGAYISTDGGKTWNQINEGLLGATVVYSIAVDKDSNVYAATPYGIFKLEGR